VGILIRTDDIPLADRYETWRSVVCDTLGPLDMRIDPDAPLRGEIAAGQLGAVIVGSVDTSTPHSVHRTRGLIRKDSPQVYRVALAVAGSPLLRQGDRVARLRPGEFAVYDFTKPYDLGYDTAVKLAVFSIPHQLLGLPGDVMTRLAAVPITAGSGTGALASPLLRRLAKDLDTYSPASSARLSAVVTDLITSALAEQAGEGEIVPQESRERMLRIRVTAFIERHLDDPELAPGTIAAGNFVSLRHLHRLFERENTTVSAWIRHRRLERCCRDLADPANATVPVSAIAAKWGLSDPAHFSRVFRHAYGIPPNEYRRMRLGL
jgi:AraC-like DNA-binding protein